MEQTILISLPIKDLQTLITECINACLKNQPQNEKDILNNTQDLLTIKEAADFLHLTIATCYTKVSKRELPVMKKGRRLYFSKAELIKWLQEGRRKTNEEIDQQATDYLTPKKSKKCQ